ncbi:MAG: CRTAC1 family protein [Acidobacteriota bacterium]
MHRMTACVFLLFLMAALVTLTPPAAADQGASGGVTYDNVADDGIGIEFSKGRSPEFATVEAFAESSLTQPIGFFDRVDIPEMTGGYPGVALFDFDGDGDLDIYATNGPDRANSLFRNLLADSDQLAFVDVATSTGVDATEQDSAGVCFGDLDNDGDSDLVVLGRHDDNLLFENRGGTFVRVANSGIGGGERWSSSCSVGDVDGDGLLDIAVANTADTTDSRALSRVAFSLNEHNQLFKNLGSLSFEDVSVEAGFENTTGFGPGRDGNPTITWAISLVDLDLDGDLDLVWADDQAALRFAFAGGIDRGFLQVYLNDGTGRFEGGPIEGPQRTGTWMGLDFGDLNCDGTLDLFATNFGDFGAASLGGFPPPVGFAASRWLLGAGDGSFTDQGTGGLPSAFGWGSAIFDYDKDADLDILYHGGLDTSLVVVADNPGALLQNQGCSAQFEVDTAAFPDDPACLDSSGQPIAGCTIHIRRNVRGVALGDLDGNGFEDVVTVANIRSQESLPLVDSPSTPGGALDPTAFGIQVFVPTPEGSVWSGILPEEGDLAVELSSDNGNRWAAITPRGSIGLVSGARVNRDGIGAVVSFTPRHGQTVISPVVGGSSHLSQHALEKIFGLGDQNRGRVEILWPGGVRNRFYGVRSDERLELPEIPCSFEGRPPFLPYATCVAGSLQELREQGEIDRRLSKRLFVSALVAYFEG